MGRKRRHRGARRRRREALPEPDPFGGVWFGVRFEYIAGWTEAGIPFGVVAEDDNTAPWLDGDSAPPQPQRTRPSEPDDLDDIPF